MLHMAKSDRRGRERLALIVSAGQRLGPLVLSISILCQAFVGCREFDQLPAVFGS